MMYQNWRQQLESLNTNFDVPLTIANPATLEEITVIEKEIGYEIPFTFKKVLLEFSSSLSFKWSINNKIDELPKEIQNGFSGQCSWDINRIINYDQERLFVNEHYVSNPDDEWERLLYQKLPIFKTENGDVIAIDLADKFDGPIIYLSYHGNDDHGHILGKNFIDFIDKWIQLGCIGPNISHMKPFLNSFEGGLLIDSEQAKNLKKVIFQ